MPNDVKLKPCPWCGRRIIHLRKCYLFKKSKKYFYKGDKAMEYEKRIIKSCPFCSLKMEPRNGGKFYQHPHSQCIVNDLILEHKVDYDMWNTRAKES